MGSIMTRKSETIDNFRYDSIQEQIQTLEMKYNSLLVEFERMTHRCCELDNRIEKIKYHLYESNLISHQIVNHIYDIVKDGIPTDNLKSKELVDNKLCLCAELDTHIIDDKYKISNV